MCTLIPLSDPIFTFLICTVKGCNMEHGKKPRVVVVGAGFGGLWAVRTLAAEPVDILVLDRNNYHTFLALLYQVAAAELEAEDIAYPVRSIFRDLPDVDFALASAHQIDIERRVVKTDNQEFPYDYLILATGSIPHTFGIPGVEEHAYFLKTLEEGVTLKNHIVCCFERAARLREKAEVQGVLTFVIVGGGATGVEYAGALSELIHGPIIKEYRNIDFRSVRIILLEAADRLVGNMPKFIQSYTVQRLRQMGVDVRLSTKVVEVTPEAVMLVGDEAIPTQTVVWTAGVRGESLASVSGISTAGDDRVSRSSDPAGPRSSRTIRHRRCRPYSGKRGPSADGGAGGDTIGRRSRAKYRAADGRTGDDPVHLS